MNKTTINIKVLSLMVLCLTGCNSGTPNNTSVPITTTTSTPVATAAHITSTKPDIPIIKSNWIYFSHPGDSFHKPTYSASTDSTNTLKFSFPYNGPQHPTLYVRNNSDGTIDVFVTFKGQINCSFIENDCSVLAKFDNHKTREFSVSGSSDNSTGIFFIEGTTVFLSQLVRAHKLAMDVTFYQEGDHELDFDVGGLDAEKICHHYRGKLLTVLPNGKKLYSGLPICH
ncbi:MAG: hypothetical protein ACRER0_02175 [Gammaproteobacteria bacterium]